MQIPESSLDLRWNYIRVSYRAQWLDVLAAEPALDCVAVVVVSFVIRAAKESGGPTTQDAAVLSDAGRSLAESGVESFDQGKGLTIDFGSTTRLEDVLTGTILDSSENESGNLNAGVLGVGDPPAVTCTVIVVVTTMTVTLSAGLDDGASRAVVRTDPGVSDKVLEEDDLSVSCEREFREVWLEDGILLDGIAEMDTVLLEDERNSVLEVAEDEVTVELVSSLVALLLGPCGTELERLDIVVILRIAVSVVLEIREADVNEETSSQIALRIASPSRPAFSRSSTSTT